MKPPDKLEFGVSRVVFAPMSSGSEDIISFYTELKSHYPRFSTWVRWGFFVGVQHPMDYRGLDSTIGAKLASLFYQIDCPGLLVKEPSELEVVRVRAEDLRPTLEEAILKHTTICLDSPEGIVAILQSWLSRCTEIYIHDAYLLKHFGSPKARQKPFLKALQFLNGKAASDRRKITLLRPRMDHKNENPEKRLRDEEWEERGAHELEQLEVEVVSYTPRKDGLSHARWIYSPDGLCLFVDAGFDFLRDSTVLCCPPDPDTARRMLDFVKTCEFRREAKSPLPLPVQVRPRHP